MLPLHLLFFRHFPSEGNAALSRFRKWLQEMPRSSRRRLFTPEFFKRFNAHFRVMEEEEKKVSDIRKWFKEFLEKRNLSNFDLYTSPHIRALETGVILDPPNAEWKIDPRLRECHPGIWGAIPDEKWQKRYEMSMRPEQNHRFYTRMPDGESIEDGCRDVESFVNSLRNERCKQAVLAVSHGSKMQAARVVLQGILPDDFDRQIKANERESRIGNCQVDHYTREDPISLGMPKRINYNSFEWVESINLLDPEYSGHGWKVISPNSYSTEDLRKMVERYPRLLKK